MQFRPFSSSDGDFGRRRLADALRKDVDGIAPSDCGARMEPIRYLRFAQNAPCPPCTLARVPLDCDCNATCHRPWPLGARALRCCLPRIVRRNAFGNSATAIRLRARSPEPAVIIDTRFRLVRGASNDAAAHPKPRTAPCDRIGTKRKKEGFEIDALTRVGVDVVCDAEKGRTIGQILLQKSFWGAERKFLEPLMRLAPRDVRDLIVSQKSDHGPSYWRYGALQRWSCLKYYFREILGVVRFSTFATKSAQSGRRAGSLGTRLGIHRSCCLRLVCQFTLRNTKHFI